MKAIRVHEFGGPEVLRLEDVPTPRPGAEQVLVRVKAVAQAAQAHEDVLAPGAFGKIVLVP